MIKINEKNLLETYTATMLQGSVESLMSYPALKSVQSNDWAEHSGLEVDLSNPKLESRALELSFYLEDKEQYEPFTDELVGTSETKLNLLEKDFYLRFTGIKSYAEYGLCCEVVCEFSEDTPLKNYTYTAPNELRGSDHWIIDNTPVSKYGLFVLQGTYVPKGKKVKPPLLLSNSQTNGVEATEKPVIFQNKEMTFYFLLKKNKSKFCALYDALLNDLTKPDYRILSYYSKSYPFFYKNSKVTKFFLKNNDIYCEFEVTIII